MSFNDHLAQAERVRASNVCTVVLWRDTLSDQDQTEFDTAMASDVTHSALYRAMRSSGFDKALSALQRHRTGGCTCGLR